MAALPPDPPAGGGPDARPSAAYRDPEVNLGGADAVQKTTALGASGSTSPDETPERPAAIPAGHGLGAAGWVAIVGVLLVLAFYLSGVLF